MKRFALLVLLLLVVPGSAAAAGCSPLNCAPSQFVIAHGTLLAARGTAQKPLRVIDLRTGATKWRLPPGIVTGDTLVHLDGSRVTWWNAARGTRIARAAVPSGLTLVGTSQNAARAVLSRTQDRGTTFVIASRSAERVVKLAGINWQFDALNGDNLILLQQLKYGYKVRLYDLAKNELQPQALKDPGESALIQGLAFARASSPNGRYLFTLYINGNGGAMIHELDTLAGRAYCIDLPGSSDYNAAMTWAIVPTRDNSTVWAVSPGYGRLAAVDVAAHAVRERAAFAAVNWTANAGMAALSPDGKQLVVTDAQHTWFASLSHLAVTRGPSHTAIALAFSPDGHRVWGVGQRSRVFALRVNR